MKTRVSTKYRTNIYFNSFSLFNQIIKIACVIVGISSGIYIEFDLLLNEKGRVGLRVEIHNIINVYSVE